MSIKLDKKLKQLKLLEEKIVLLTGEKEAIGKETFAIIEAETDGQYKNEIATVTSQVQSIGLCSFINCCLSGLSHI